jgi:NAD+ synthase (glutamine-hydrolysing)
MLQIHKHPDLPGGYARRNLAWIFPPHYTGRVKIALGQINPTVGDFVGNATKIVQYAQRARKAGAELVLFPELSICGYPPRDLVERTSFVARNRQIAEEIARETLGITAVVGLVTPASSSTGKSVMNSAAVLRDGKIALIQSKRLLPTYDVFDEMRNFAWAESQELFCQQNVPVALTICEDAWNDEDFWERPLYGKDPVADLMLAGGKILLNISASPFYVGKQELRKKMLAAIARKYKVPVALCNQVGGNDSVLFDGSSIVLGPDGEVISQARSFEEDLIFSDTDNLTGDVHSKLQGDEANAYAALVMGTRDYVHKCGFRKALIGLSGGIDSALAAAIAVDALGAENVMGIGMPGPYSSQGSIDDAAALAKNLGIRFEIIPIGDIYEVFRKTLTPIFTGLKEDTTEENIQSRVRGNILMSLSNKFGALVLSTGNKSELAVGYCTLYGDMAGGLAVISDVPKTMVYRLSHYVNSRGARIPAATIEKPPSAELRPDQKDTDSLPEYEVLDAILDDYVEEMKSAGEIAKGHGFDIALVRRVLAMIERTEYKRQQAAPGLKISTKAFGVGRRLPIAARIEVQ